MSFFNWVKMIFGLSLLVGLAYGYFYVVGLQKDLKAAEAAVATKTLALEVANSSNAVLQQTIAEYQSKQEEFQSAVQQLQSKWNVNDDESERLREMFLRHDLGGLAHEKPGIIERRINGGTANSIRLLNGAGADSNAGRGD